MSAKPPFPEFGTWPWGHHLRNLNPILRRASNPRIEWYRYANDKNYNKESFRLKREIEFDKYCKLARDCVYFFHHGFCFSFFLPKPRTKQFNFDKRECNQHTKPSFLEMIWEPNLTRNVTTIARFGTKNMLSVNSIGFPKYKKFNALSNQKKRVVILFFLQLMPLIWSFSICRWQKYQVLNFW